MGRTALVTGMDTSSIAISVCSSLVRAGYSVVATSEGGFDAGQPKRLKFDEEHADATPVVFEGVDFYSAESLTALISRLSHRIFDVIVNCGTTLALTANGELRDEGFEFDYHEFNRVMQYNVTSVAAICLGLKDSIADGGVIINVTSSAALEGAFATISYNASKAAVNNLTKSLANTLGPSRGVRVNGIAPGWIPPSSDAAAEGVVALANSLTPSLVHGRPEDVVSAVHYLIDARFQNGTVFPVDGGITSSYLVYMLESLQLRGVPMDSTIENLAAMIGASKRDLRTS